MVKSLRSPVPGEKKYHLGYPSGRKGGSAGGWGPPVPGGGALAIGGSFLAILGAGCIAGAAADAADFCGGALGDAAVNKGGGALNGIPDLAIGWSAASAGTVGGSGFGEPTMLLGVGGGLGFGDVKGDVPVAVEILGSCGAFLYEAIVAWSLVFGLMNCPTVSPITCAMPLELEAASDLAAALLLAFDRGWVCPGA